MAEVRQGFEVRDGGNGQSFVVISVLTDAGTKFEWCVPIATAKKYAANFALNVGQCVDEHAKMMKTKLVVPGTGEVQAINGKR